jgi:hypothetical protein
MRLCAGILMVKALLVRGWLGVLTRTRHRLRRPKTLIILLASQKCRDWVKKDDIDDGVDEMWW